MGGQMLMVKWELKYLVFLRVGMVLVVSMVVMCAPRAVPERFGYLLELG